MPESMPTLSTAQVREWFSKLPTEEFAGKQVLVIIPDATRTAPLPLLFDALYSQLRPAVAHLDVLVALGTHPPMSDAQMCKLLGIDEQERGRLFYQLGLFNHEWDRPERLLTIGTLTRQDTSEISGGLLSLDVPVQINSRIADYDVLLVLGPVFPH